jgi:phage baseplate assembly protein W
MAEPRKPYKSDDLGVQAGYLLSAVDESGNPPTALEFGGLSPSITLRLPPQSLQIQRSIRAEVLKDLGRGVSVVTGGEGLGKIQIQGTHGVGAFVDATTQSPGKEARDALKAFFGAFVGANDERGRTGKEGLRLIFRMMGGGFSNPANEAYLVWPDSFPTDIRSASRPHAWDWGCTLSILAPYRLPPTVDPSKLKSTGQLLKDATALDKLLASAAKTWKGALSVLQDIRDLRSKLAQIKNSITAFVSGAKDAIYQVTDLVRGSAQLCTGILNALSVTAFLDSAQTAIRGTVYEVRRFLGQCSITANQFKRSGAVQSSLTSTRTASPARPVVLALSPGDSLQAIAARVLGSSSRWTELVTVNNLVFPFVDFSGPNGRPGSAYAGLRVLGANDTLKLPLPVVPGVVGVSDDPIGTDTPDAPGHIGDLQGGADNMVASLMRRLSTPRGHIPWHPSYGSGLKARIGSASTTDLVLEAMADAKDTLNSDPRVLAVNRIDVAFLDGLVDIYAEVVTPVGAVSLAGAVS